MKTLLTVLFVMLCLTPSFADEGLYVTGAIGQSRFSLTTPDGTWRQEGLGYHAVREAFAWSAGLGYGWENWAVEAAYVDFGRMSSGGRAVADWAYDCDDKSYDRRSKSVAFDATDSLQAGTLRVKYNLDVWGVRPFLAAGIFAGTHEVTSWFGNTQGTTRHYPFDGVLAGPVVGGGICYKWVCGQVDYYRAVVQGGFPISTEIVMPSAMVKIPLTWDIGGDTRDYLWQR